MLKKVQIMPYFGKKLIFWFFCIWFKVQGRHLSKKVTLKAYPYFENKGGSFKYIFYQKVLRFSCMCSEKVILYKKWSFPFFAPLRMIFQKATLLNIFSKFHLKTILLNKSITKFFFFKDLEGKIENFQKMSISGPDLRSKNRRAEMALCTMAFVIKLSKTCEIFFEKFRCIFWEIDF